MAARKTATKQLFVNHLLEAVKFVGLAQRGNGDETTQHAIVRYGAIIASNRTLAAGARIAEDDLDCCPHVDRLRLALEHCGQEHTIIQSADSLFVRSGEFSAYVPLCDPAKLTVATPDPAVAPLGDAFRASLVVAGSLVRENAPTVLHSCIQLNPYSVVATNGAVILEHWHGFDMPPGLLIPKSFAEAVCKSRGVIAAFGFTKATFTIHYEDKSWLRTNLYQEEIPNMLAKLPCGPVERPVPAGFFKQVAEVAKWSEDGRVYFREFVMSSHPSNTAGCFELKPESGLPEYVSYTAASLKSISQFATHFEDRINPHATMFFGTNLRGVIAHEAITA